MEFVIMILVSSAYLSAGADLNTDPYLLSIILSFPRHKMGKSTEPKETRKHVTRKI
jgi:hypothetical protein